MFTNRAERTVREALAQGGGETYKHMVTIVRVSASHRRDLPTGFLTALGVGKGRAERVVGAQKQRAERVGGGSTREKLQSSRARKGEERRRGAGEQEEQCRGQRGLSLLLVCSQ